MSDPEAPALWELSPVFPLPYPWRKRQHIGPGQGKSLTAVGDVAESALAPRDGEARRAPFRSQL